MSPKLPPLWALKDTCRLADRRARASIRRFDTNMRSGHYVRRRAWLAVYRSHHFHSDQSGAGRGVPVLSGLDSTSCPTFIPGIHSWNDAGEVGGSGDCRILLPLDSARFPSRGFSHSVIPGPLPGERRRALSAQSLSPPAVRGLRARAWLRLPAHPRNCPLPTYRPVWAGVVSVWAGSAAERPRWR